MKVMKWIGWCGMVLLVASMMWTTGCGGSDGDGGNTTTIVVTNATGETTIIVVTNEPATGNEPAEAQLHMMLPAPQQVKPHEGQEFTTLVPTFPVTVEFQWTAVSGAASYVLEVDGAPFAVGGTTHAVALAIGAHKWRVSAIEAGGHEGTVSDDINFSVKLDSSIFTP